MFGSNRPEVLIVGAGPIGLITALVLMRRGIKVEIIDKAEGPAAHAYALALHPSAMAVLDQLGVLPEILAGHVPIEHLALYDERSLRLELGLSSVTAGRPPVAVVRQDRLERTLTTALARLGVQVHWLRRLSALQQADREVRVEIDWLEKGSIGYPYASSELLVRRTERLEVPFVIGADGTHSAVRRLSEIEFVDAAPPVEFAVFQFRTGAALGTALRLILAESLAAVVWPLPDQQYRWSFQLPELGHAGERVKSRHPVERDMDALTELNDAALEALLRERAPWFDGAIDEVVWRTLVRFERGMVESFGRHRVWLAGDAGHMTSPAGIQSMNVGVYEGRDLAARIAAVLRDGAPLSHIDGYAEERRLEWRALLGLGRPPQAERFADPWVARHAARIVPALPASGAELPSLAARLGLLVGSNGAAA